MALYPLLLEPIYKEKVWGGRALERVGHSLPGGPDVLIGESWELSDIDETAPSGGGGGAAHSRIRNGPLRKRTLRDVLGEFHAHIMGTTEMAPSGRFPILLKYLDARQNLSIQVHPSPEYVAEHPEAAIKYEALYVVDAEPGAVLYKGLVEGTTADDVRGAVEAGTLADLLVAVPAVPGQVHYIPSGMCHALGAGIVVAEVQTVSDTTFRLYDWDRPDRELHVEAALECVDLTLSHPCRGEVDEPLAGESATGRRIVDVPHFRVDEWCFGPGEQQAWPSDRVCALMIVGGAGEIRWGEDGQRSLSVEQGDTVLLPAVLADAWSTTDGAMTVLEVTLPDPSDRGAQPHA